MCLLEELYNFHLQSAFLFPSRFSHFQGLGLDSCSSVGIQQPGRGSRLPFISNSGTKPHVSINSKTPYSPPWIIFFCTKWLNFYWDHSDKTLVDLFFVSYLKHVCTFGSYTFGSYTLGLKLSSRVTRAMSFLELQTLSSLSTGLRKSTENVSDLSYLRIFLPFSHLIASMTPKSTYLESLMWCFAFNISWFLL